MADEDKQYVKRFFEDFDFICGINDCDDKCPFKKCSKDICYHMNMIKSSVDEICDIIEKEKRRFNRPVVVRHYVKKTIKEKEE